MPARLRRERLDPIEILTVVRPGKGNAPAGIARRGAEAGRLAKIALNLRRHGTDSGRDIERVAQAALFESDEKRRRMDAFLDRKQSRRDRP